MAQTYLSRDGDVLDAIAAKQYGSCNGDILNLVMEANPHLVGYDRLPRGLLVTLPDVAVTPTPAAAGVSLWD